VDAAAAAYDERRQRDQTKLEQMVVYAQTALCRTAARRSGKQPPISVAPATTALARRFAVRRRRKAQRRSPKEDMTMARVQNATPSSGAGPILGALGAVGLT
jgi:hypothetical protein